MNDKAATLVRKIEEAEGQGLYEEAQSAREKLLDIASESLDSGFIDVVDHLAREKITVHGVEAAEVYEPFYLRLNSMVKEGLGADSITSAFVKRKLAKVFYIQGRTQDAITMAEAARSIFSARLGKNDNETVEAVLTLTSWHKEAKTLQTQIFLDWVSREYPICEHLQPLERSLKSSGFGLEHNMSYHGHVGIRVNGWLDLDALHKKLKLGPCVQKELREDMRDGSFRGFVCSEHKHEIEGRFEQSPEWPNID